MLSLVFSPCLYIWESQACNNGTSFFLLKEVRPHWIWRGAGQAGSTGPSFSRCELQPEMAQVLERTAGLEPGSVCLDLICKYLLCYKTSFTSSYLQFSRVDTSTLHCLSLHGFLCWPCGSLDLSSYICKVGLRVLILTLYQWKKNWKCVCQAPEDQTWEYLTYTAFF